MNIMNVVALSVAERAVWLWCCDEILALGEKIMIDSDVAPCSMYRIAAWESQNLNSGHFMHSNIS
jgi:hypothetical protein